MVLRWLAGRRLCENRSRFHGIENWSDLNVIVDRSWCFHIRTLCHFAAVDLRYLNISNLAWHVYCRLDDFFAISSRSRFLFRRLWDVCDIFRNCRGRRCCGCCR